MSRELTIDEVRAKHLAALIAEANIDHADIAVPQTIVRPEDDRIDSGMAVAYLVGQAAVVRCDPVMAGPLEELSSSTSSVTSDDFAAWGIKQGWEFIDGNDVLIVAAADLAARPLPADATLVELSRESDEHRSLIAGLLERNNSDDVEEAEFAMDDLDPHIVGLLDNDGQLRALASGRIWDADEDFDDIGVLTDEPVRGRGWGGAIVSAFCEASFDRGRLPLYRCNWSRTASKALALSLGFDANMRLSAIGLPEDD